MPKTKYSSRCIKSCLSAQVELSLWDTAGQERFHSLGPIYYRDAAAALIVFDITDIDSFERAKAWVKELYQMVSVFNKGCTWPQRILVFIFQLVFL